MMDFGQAIAALKAGEAVARAGWNGKGMHIYLLTGSVGGFAPCICMYTAQGTHQPGWLASQPDMLSEDWSIVRPA